MNVYITSCLFFKGREKDFPKAILLLHDCWNNVLAKPLHTITGCEISYEELFQAHLTV